MAHITDPHLSSERVESYGNIYDRMSKVVNVIKPHKILMTGDITDGSRNSTTPMYTSMVKADWDLYQKLLNDLNISSDLIVYCAGNHDVFDLSSIDSEHNYAKGIIYDPDTYELKKEIFEIEGFTFSTISVNTFQFPAPTEKLEDWAFPKYALRTAIINELKKASADYTILLSHFPVLGWYPNFASTSNYALSDILLLNPTARYFLAGHLHPQTTQYYHHGDTLEVVGTPLFRHNSIGLVTFDNKRSAYHEIDLDQEIIAVITNPIPLKQASGLDVFNELSTEVRVLVFTNKPINLTASVIDKTETLTCHSIKDGVQLCSCPLEIGEGKYDLNITGDWNRSVSFAIGETIIGFKEKQYDIPASISYIFIYIFLLVVVLVLALPVSFTGVSEAFDRWMRSQESESHWAIAIFGGFLTVKHRLNNSPSYIRIPIFLCALFSLILPTYFFTIDGKVAIMWAWGYCSVGKNIFIFRGLRLNVFYLSFVIIPVILFASAIDATKVRTSIFVMDVIIYLSFYAGIVILIRNITEMHGLKTSLTSPEFVFAPLYFLVALCFYIRSALKEVRNRSSNSDLIQDQILI
ncbi:Ser/Thr protein phosphatase [Histomonas meleagridis]|uniref:Ser/Thr protein phosphatase n=1 Tax=Histomonas meleagridis TaxID=135588 RepID=UPI00355AC194|nr:Ser/Thr protein phosphatase [Histomonas meleagridis]KAH0796241.1 Ser/Thr protein phosphatase [Histomonas meleagridis]